MSSLIDKIASYFWALMIWIAGLLPDWQVSLPTTLTSSIQSIISIVSKANHFFPIDQAFLVISIYIGYIKVYGLARPLLKWIKAD